MVMSPRLLERLTPPIHEACTDDRRCQFQQRFVDIQPSFKADSQLAKACKPAVRPLHHPPVFAQPLAALNASSGNSANDAPLPQVGSASLEVVAFVGVQLCRSSTGTSWQASNRRNRVHAPLEHLGVVPVRAADQDHQRDASGIYNDVSLGAELASVRRVGPRCLAPGGLVPRSHQCCLGSNRFGHVHASESAWPGATVPTHQRHSSRAGAASKSCRYRTQEIGEGLPMECLFAARTGCR
ncbi:hypothetical protein CLV01_5270 [Delftia sp. 60]|nr:hypothetical protein CLU98_1184 [Burkholderiales bacterium 23]PIF68809.1 hypothetical protein CLV01_5270 [Delftia sp. 60]